jgi:hypothetical protein
MKHLDIKYSILAGAPLIGEGNLIDSRAILQALSAAGMPGFGFYPNGTFVKLGRTFHIRMSMSTLRTMEYALSSHTTRLSLRVKPLKWELRRAIKKAKKIDPYALCFITSQNMMAEESIGMPANIPTLMASSDVFGKYNSESKVSEKQRNIIYLVWNREALHLYRNELNLENVYLIKPVDPMLAFEPIEKSNLPFQFALDEPDICFIKLSGSGGDPELVNAAINSLWAKSRVKSIVFPGIKKTERKIIKTVGSNVTVNSSLEASVFYHHARAIISNRQMFLAYPSEQVKHVVILTQNNIFPKIVWLPPRGVHEMDNLIWAIRKGFSGTLCVPTDHHSLLKRSLMKSGINSSSMEFVDPDNLSAEHFKPSPVFESEKNACSIESVIKKIVSA